MEEGCQEGIPPSLRHPLEGLAGGPAGDLGQALEPVGAQAIERPPCRATQPEQALDDRPLTARRADDDRGARRPGMEDRGDVLDVRSAMDDEGVTGGQRWQGMADRPPRGGLGPGVGVGAGRGDRSDVARCRDVADRADGGRDEEGDRRDDLEAATGRAGRAPAGGRRRPYEPKGDNRHQVPRLGPLRTVSGSWAPVGLHR